MKNLYLKFIDLKTMGHQQLPGTLEISETGLKVNYIRELHRGVQEIFNPFPTIAVWAAVKFVHKKEHTAGGEIHHRCMTCKTRFQRDQTRAGWTPQVGLPAPDRRS